MNKKDTQRKTLAMLVLFFIAYIYVEKVLTPYFQPPVPEKARTASEDVRAGADARKNASEVFGGFPELAKESDVSSGSVVSSGAVLPEGLREKQAPRSSAPADRDILESGLLNLENDVFKIRISKLGGRFQSIELKKYKRSHPNDTAQYEMISHADGMAYPGGLLFQGGADTWVTYQQYQLTPQGEKRPLPGDSIVLSDSLPEIRIRMEGVLEDGRGVFKELHFSRDSYLFDVSMGFLDKALAEPFFMEWQKYVDLKDTSLLDPYDTDGFVWFNGDKSERLTFNDMTKESPSKTLESLLWLGFGNKYFATAFVYNDTSSDTASESNTAKKINGKPLFPTQAQIEKRGSFVRTLFSQNEARTPLAIQVFSGPKSYSMLDTTGFELKRLLDLGMTGVISAPLLSLLNLFYKFVGNYGLAIVLLTIVVKFALYPLNAAQFKQMKALQALKPELDRIKESIKDRQQQQQALMDMYKKKGVNPLGGCLPILIQMPIFIGLYSALMLSVELRHADFGMWVHDLSAPDRLMIGDFGIPVLVLLFTISMMVQQWITPTAVDPAQKKAMMIMPVLMFFMFMSFPSGLALYWLTNNLFSIGQQQAIQYNDKHGKSGFKITALVALGVFVLSYLCTLI